MSQDELDKVEQPAILVPMLPRGNPYIAQPSCSLFITSRERGNEEPVSRLGR